MPVTGLFHIAIKTADLEATRRFYKQVLGMKEYQRPPLPFPGAWLGPAAPDGNAIFHIYAGEPAKVQGRVPSGTGAVDHLSIAAHGYDDFRARIRKLGLEWREQCVPNTTYWQIFVYDPSGLMLELTFDGAGESGGPPDESEQRRYVAGEPFFEPDRYRQFALAEA